MASIFRLQNDDGTPGNWAFFSEKKGDIVDVGPDEQEAQARANAEGPQTTIASALAGDAATTATTPEASNVVDDGAVSSDSSTGSGPITASDSGPSGVVIQSAPASTPKVEPAKPERPPLSPAFIKKLVGQLGSNTTNMSIEFERWMMDRFGYTTEELSEDDPDVEIIREGWNAIWQSYLAGKDPPLWMILAFGYSCVTVRLIASAKKKAEPIEATATVKEETKPDA